ncbi:MAG: mechanosensitive ion channel [Alphaproteobacteria bacterium]|nr:mechanosensitive ion channel [Alphaproteobacteria bacterium]
MEQMNWAMEKGYQVGTGALMALVILIVGWIIAGRVEAAIRAVGNKRSLDVALSGFLASMARYTVIAATVIAALGKVGVETASLMAIFASAGLAVGLALQGSLSNFASGVMILFFRPFTVGDVISAAGETGAVHDIGLFATTLINPSNHKIIVANSAITSGNITNFTTLGTRRTTVEFGVAYGSDIDRVCAVAKKAAMTCPVVILDPAEPAVAFTALGASSLNFACHSWSKASDWLACQHQVRKAIYDALNAEGIEIPFDQIVVHQA